MRVAKLADVAPAIPAKRTYGQSDTVWVLGLDRVEADSGKVSVKEYKKKADAGPSVHPFDTGNVLYSKLRPYLNKVVLPDESGLATTELVTLRPDPDLLDRNFLASYLRSPKFVAWATKETGGAKMPRVVMKAFWEQEVPLPPLEEQKRIAAILDKADELRTKRKEAIAELDKLQQSVFLDMFGDPVTNPKGWEIAPLADVSSCPPQYGAGASAVDFVEGASRYIRITDVQANGDLSDERKSAELSEADEQKYLLQSGDLLFARSGATVGKTYLHREESEKSVYAGYLIRFKLDVSRLLPEFAFAFTKTHAYEKWVSSKARVVAQPNINAKQYSALQLPVPPIEAQKRFADTSSRIRFFKDTLSAHLSELDALFYAFQSKAFKGEL